MIGPKKLCQQLEALAASLGARVIYDDVMFTGGHCWCKGQLYIIIDRRLSLNGRIRLLCAGISELPWETAQLPPEIRSLLITREQTRFRPAPLQ